MFLEHFLIFHLSSFTGFSQGAVFKAMIVFLLAASTHSRPQVKRDIAAHAEPVAWHDTEEDDIPNTFTKRDVDDHTDSLDLDDCQINCQFLSNVIKNVTANREREKICKLGYCICAPLSIWKSKPGACEQCLKEKTPIG